MNDPRTSVVDGEYRLALQPGESTVAAQPTGTASTGVGAATPPQLKLACPKCGGSAMVAWNRLDGHFFCRRCTCWYRVERRGLTPCQPPDAVQVKVRGSFSEWESTAVSLSRRTVATNETFGTGTKKWRAWRVRLSAAVVVALLVAGGLTWGLRGAANGEVVDAPLPDALEGRVGLFAEAWLRNDLPKLLQLTPPSQDRTLRRWLTRHVPPVSSNSAGWEVDSVSITPVNERTADVAIRFAHSGDTAHEPIKLEQRWFEQDGAWRFTPPMR